MDTSRGFRGCLGVWLGYPLADPVVGLLITMLCRMSIGVAPELSVAEGHAIAIEVRHQLLHHVRYLSEVGVHVDPWIKQARSITVLSTMSMMAFRHIHIDSIGMRIPGSVT